MTNHVEFSSASDPAALAAFAKVGRAADWPAGGDPLIGAVALALTGPARAPRARASLWLADDLVGAPGRSGLLGHYAAADREAGVAVLAATRAELERRGAVRVLGPMNGSTWRRYRVELPREAGDPDVRPERFAGEPTNPPHDAEDFTAAGFHLVARYESRYEPEPVLDPGLHTRARERAIAQGLRLHALDLARFTDTLRSMHELSVGAFAENLFYGPLSLDDFLAAYASFRERAVPELVRLATGADGRLAGYLFGYPDPLTLAAGRPVRTVCKTVAVARHARGSGLGALLLDDFRAASVAYGARGIVHALMHVDNASMRMSTRHHSVLFKRYALFGWTP